MITWLWSIRRSPPCRRSRRLRRARSARRAPPGEATSVAAPTMSATPTSSTCSTFTRARLRNDLAARQLLVGRAATSTEPPRRSSSSSAACLVDGASNARGVEHEQRAALGVHRQRAAQRGAARLAVDLDDVVARARAEDDAAAGPHAASGSCPARARPVPFWRHGLAPPPRTMPRVLVACVPWRRAASSATTTSCTSGPLNGAPKTSASSVDASCRRRGSGASGIGAHLHGAALGARARSRGRASGSGRGSARRSSGPSG